MQHDRIHRVVYVETLLSEYEVRDTFARYGRIRDIYPCKPGPHRESTRYFVEFEQEHGAKGAGDLLSDRYSVHMPAHSPRLASCFWDVVSPEQASPFARKDLYQASGSAKRSNSRRAHIPSPSPPGNTTVSRTHTRPSGSRPDSAPESSKRSVWTSPIRLRLPPQRDQEKENRAVVPPGQSHASPKHGPSSPLAHKTAINSGQTFPIDSTPRPRKLMTSKMAKHEAIKAEPDVDAHLAPQEDTRGGSTSALPEPQPVASPISSLITWSRDGSRYSYELDEFAEDPARAITVLTETAAGSLERDKWMIVAAHCRRKQKVRAAISILIAMVDVMTSPGVGLTQEDMKPVYLMLGSCYTDLSRQVRCLDGSGVDLAKENMVKASEYFRMVYGEYVPDSLVSHSPSLVSRMQEPTGKKDAKKAPADSPHGASAPERKRKDQVPPEDEGRLKRDNQSLRDRQKHHIATISGLRDAIRKLEEELEAERGLHRETEVALTEELQGARRSTKYALEQCKREVENRRRIEERVVELRDEVAVVKLEADAVARSAQDKDRKTRDFFVGLGSLFTRAAHGELEDSIAPMLSGPSGSRRSVEVTPPSEGSQEARPWKRARMDM